ncbi:MAG: 4-hydroxy-tetrahydrodipicolinate reductase [Ruminiclostridium sp.]
MTNIALVGACGKMGKVIAGLVAQRTDCKICAGVDLYGEQYSDFPVYTKIFDMQETPDVIIDFSSPVALDDLLTYCKMKNTPVVLATTGYDKEQIEKIRLASEQIAVFFTFNMSLGINLLVDLAKRATKVLGGQFDIEIVEKHHNLKKDAPSGTAIMIAEAINGELDNKMKYVYDRHSVRKPRDKEEIGLHSIRGGTIVGEHDIIFAGHDEVITLSHSAQSKEVFAVGSINAALFLCHKEKGLYEMSDILKD